MGLDEKIFDNFFKVAEEFKCITRNPGGRYYFEDAVLNQWLIDYRWRTVVLDKDDYRRCLDFALAMHL